MTGRASVSQLALFFLLLFVAMPTAMRAQPDGGDRGAQQYTANCSACHGADAKGGDKAAAVATTLSLMTLSDEELARILRQGTAEGMPPFAQIGDANITAIVSYLRTLEMPASAEHSVVSAAAAALTGRIDATQSDLLQPQVASNWVSYNGDYTGRRYSGLSQITPANVGRMAAQWVFHVRDPGPLEVTPVVVAGVMFVTSANDVYALDAKTGDVLWHHARAVSQGLVDDAANHHNRGVAILGTRIYMETDNAHLLCLDARSGDLLWDVLYATGNKNYGATSAPLIVHDKVVVGSSGGDDGVRGFLAAFDAKTGKEVWRFWTVPGPGEKGNESWPGDAYLHGGGTTWMPGTYDSGLNTLYWGTGNPSPDYDGSVRPGDDLYTSSLLALDPDTGRLKWYFQYSPHDLYDYDAVQTPVLVDATFRGRQRKLVVTANRNGFLYILDRTNGKFLLAKQFASLQTWAKGIDENGRPITAGLIPDEQGVRVCPAAGGATNWYSPSYNLATHMFYFRSLEACAIFRSKTEPFEEGRTYYSTGTRLEPGESTKGFINAFDLDKLDFAWRDPQVGSNKGWSGVMSTATGLVAFGDDAENFVVLNGRTGKSLWRFHVGQMVHASPMSYAVDGKQYFAIAAGTDLFAFALP
jgi:alcohol dehydrogenase (cytochrome c)